MIGTLIRRMYIIECILTICCRVGPPKGERDQLVIMFHDWHEGMV